MTVWDKIAAYGEAIGGIAAGALTVRAALFKTDDYLRGDCPFQSLVSYMDGICDAQELVNARIDQLEEQDQTLRELARRYSQSYAARRQEKIMAAALPPGVTVIGVPTAAPFVEFTPDHPSRTISIKVKVLSFETVSKTCRCDIKDLMSSGHVADCPEKTS